MWATRTCNLFVFSLQSKIKELEEKLKDERDHRRMLQERALDVSSSLFFSFFFLPFLQFCLLVVVVVLTQNDLGKKCNIA